MKHPYTTLAYAESFTHVGRALEIPEWNTSVLVREIELGYEDVCGTYPLTIFEKQTDIEAGLERLRSHHFISAVFVVDDHHRPTLEKLQQSFTFVKPFKTHYVFKRQHGDIIYNKHHRYELRQAQKNVQVAALDLNQHLDAWLSLYSNLVQQKKITGVQAFPINYHIMLSNLEGVTAIGAWQQGELISCHLWIAHGDYVFSHLAASNLQGYACRAAYAINDASLHYFKSAEIINFGGGVGYAENQSDGLVKFKRGFCNDTSISYICGIILDKDRYASLVQAKGIDQTSFFPAYRAPNIPKE
jgi:hypothetical protein